MGYTSYWDMTFYYKTNLSIQDSIFHSCTFTPLLWFIKVKNVKNTSFKNPQESATSLFYLLTHKYLLQNNLQILLLLIFGISDNRNGSTLHLRPRFLRSPTSKGDLADKHTAKRLYLCSRYSELCGERPIYVSKQQDST